MKRLAPLFALGLFAQIAPAQELAVHGRPRLGDALWVEVKGDASAPVKLAYDFRLGSGAWNGVPLGLRVSGKFGIFNLGSTDTRGWLGKSVGIPNLARLDGRTVYLQALVQDAASLGGWATTDVAGQPLAIALDVPAVNDYAYQLQGNPGTGWQIDHAALAATEYDLLVVDYSKDGSDAEAFSPAEVDLMKNGPVERKLVLSYLSIGEAEDYRWYWPDVPPHILASSNPNWPGNYKVRYWLPEWKEIILSGNAAIGTSYLDRIIDAGFDGVFLDVVDAYEFFGPTSEGGVGEKSDAAIAMLEFILEIAHHARVVRGRPDFLVVPQNGLTIYTEGFYPAATLGPFDPTTSVAMAARQLDRFAATIDLLATEDVYYTGNQDENNPYAPDTYLVGLLNDLMAHGRPIFATEYLTQQSKLDQFYDTVAPAAGVIPLATVRDLDRIPNNPGHDPD